MAVDNSQAPQPKTIHVPEGGNKAFNFELTPNTLNSCDNPWRLVYINKNGKKTEVSSLSVSFSEDSSPAEMAVEYALILVSMSASAKAAGWTFVPSVTVYEDGLVAEDQIITELAYRVTADAEGSGGEISYGFLAILDKQTYTEPDPIIRVGRP